LCTKNHNATDKVKADFVRYLDLFTNDNNNNTNANVNGAVIMAQP